MFILTSDEQIDQRIKYPATKRQLSKDYKKFGIAGMEIMNWIEYFDQAQVHDKNIYDKINKFFHYIKMITPDFCSTEEKVQLLKNIAEEKKWISVKFGDNSIIDELPTFDPQNHSPEFKVISPNSPEEILDEIVYWTRFMLTREDHKVENLLNLHLINRCEEASRFIHQLAYCYHLNAQIVKIPAGFSQEELLYDEDTEFHYFVLIEIDDKTYIVDCTYSQFFSWYRNEIERLGNYTYSGCFSGIYMLKDIAREKTARTILKRGWIELNEETIKHYLDGFALSYRNGLFYENLGVADYHTPYDIKDYHNFLFGDDSQIRREGKEYLGYQMQVLKNRDFKF